MSRSLRILIVDDSQEDADVLLAELRRAGFEPEATRVDNEEDFRIEAERLPDIVLADFSLPHFNGMRALRLLRARGLDIPFILVSGVVGEDEAVEAMRHGAVDFLLKDRLARLGSAVEHALTEKQLRVDRQQAEDSMIASEARYRGLFESAKDGMLILNAVSGKIVDVSPSLIELLGVSRQTFVGKRLWDLPFIKNIAAHETVFNELRENDSFRCEHLMLETSDGRQVDVNFTSSAYVTNQYRLIQCSIHDTAERKRVECALRANRHLIEEVFNTIPVRVFWKNADFQYLGCNISFALDAGFTDLNDVIGKDDYQLWSRAQADSCRRSDREVLESGCSKMLIEDPQTTPEGKIITLVSGKIPLRDSKGEISGVLGAYMYITERSQAESSDDRMARSV